MFGSNCLGSTQSEERRMYIYVSGPYSPPSDELDPLKREKVIEENINNANKVALALARRGHFPFVPHTMMQGWEEAYGISRALALHLCHKWVERCDALYFIGPSPGAESELNIARMHNLPIFYSLDEIEEARELTEDAMSLSG